MNVFRSDGTPLAGVDALFLDLDGVVYRGRARIPHAVEVIRRVAEALPVLYLTNNASRTPEEVARRLREFGLAAGPDDIVASPHVVVDLLRSSVPTGSRILVVGGQGLVDAIRSAGFVPVSRASESPDAVVQGFDRSVCWPDLAEACLALAPRGRASEIPWVASNGDLSLPVEGGNVPGNGALVLAVRVVVGRDPVFAGKPERGMFDLACARVGARAPLVVGDRLDTDIAGARRAGLRSALVLTGITTRRDVAAAPVDRQPDFIFEDLRDLFGTSAT
ncbi:HAD-IIA family hydrolase [Microbacterium xanthum]|uniref:HAD-IIA family hydrolase n=1 Tax=Microbacterium xanthum TaxID=3079794 RepID=UPI002AD52B8B|nr:HAD-IIA family hydrolase [Microbacterium sp. KSW-48]MDZ8170815.1 HAD-IIA family hydrolase [Microbacterium sp. KSW-48]